MTYVSVDDERGLKSFQKLLEEKEISWRSVYAYENINGVKEKYFVTEIPHNILVYPDGNMEVIDVRNETELKRLYGLVNLK
jgi:pantothenate kinase